MKYLIYLLWLFVYSRSEALRRVVVGISRTQRIFLFVMIGLIIAGQINEKKYPTYPFVKWGMYAKIDHKGNVYDYRGVLPDGSEVRLPMTRVVRTHSKRFVWRLRTLTHEMEDAASESERENLEELYDRALRAAWAMYHRRNPELDLVAIRVRKIKLNTRKYRREEEIEAKLPTKIFREVQL